MKSVGERTTFGFSGVWRRGIAADDAVKVEVNPHDDKTPIDVLVTAPTAEDRARVERDLRHRLAKMEPDEIEKLFGPALATDRAALHSEARSTRTWWLAKAIDFLFGAGFLIVAAQTIDTVHAYATKGATHELTLNLPHIALVPAALLAMLSTFVGLAFVTRDDRLNYEEMARNGCGIGPLLRLLGVEEHRLAVNAKNEARADRETAEATAKALGDALGAIDGANIPTPKRVRPVQADHISPRPLDGPRHREKEA